MILRPGLITREMIARVVGDCQEYTPDLKSGEKVKSPGVLYKHYSPKCKTILFCSDEIEKALSVCHENKRFGQRIAVLCQDGQTQNFQNLGVTILNLGKTEEDMAMRLYTLLREAETLCDVLIAVEPSEKDGIMKGVLNRLRKACASEDIPHETK